MIAERKSFLPTVTRSKSLEATNEEITFVIRDEALVLMQLLYATRQILKTSNGRVAVACY